MRKCRYMEGEITMKRVAAVVLAFVMAFCLIPTSAFAATISSRRLNVVVNNAPIRAKPYQEGEVIQRCAKGSTLTYWRPYVNSRLNLWYELTYSDDSKGYIYSGNVTECEEAGAYLSFANYPQLDISRDYLNKSKCLEVAELLAKSMSMTKERIAHEIYAHAICYYLASDVFRSSISASLGVDVICKLFPGDVCYTVEQALNKIVEYADSVRSTTGVVNIGEDANFKGIRRTALYELIWGSYFTLPII